MQVDLLTPQPELLFALPRILICCLTLRHRGFSKKLPAAAHRQEGTTGNLQRWLKMKSNQKAPDSTQIFSLLLGKAVIDRWGSLSRSTQKQLF
jgi:hypothetical protein